MSKDRRGWFKSSHSMGGNGCVEVWLRDDGGAKVRDTKAGESSPVLIFTAVEWSAFLAGVRDGEFDAIG